MLYPVGVGWFSVLAEGTMNENYGLDGKVHKKPEKHANDESNKIEDQFFVLIECEDEAEQLEWLRKLMEEGVTCRALIS